MNLVVVRVPWQQASRNSPRRLTAEMKFRVKRAPVRSTVGVCQTGAHVVPLW